MVKGLSNIELGFIVAELNSVSGSKVEKIYHDKGDVFIKFYHKEKKGLTLRIRSGTALFLTDYKGEYPQKPSSFCMYLRKYLNSTIFKSASQPNLERVVELVFQSYDFKYYLICEFFSKGNVILCDDNYTILMPLRFEEWKDRSIKTRVTYKYPPLRVDFASLDKLSFRRILKSSEKQELVKSLAVDLSTGGKIAEELCAHTGIDKTKNPSMLNDKEVESLFETFSILLRHAKYGKSNPKVIVDEEGFPKDVIPFDFKIYEGEEFKPFNSFNEAVDYYYTESEILEKKKTMEQAQKEHEEDFIVRRDQQLEHITKLRDDASSMRGQANTIMNNLDLINNIVQTIKTARKSGSSWDEINELIIKEREKGVLEASRIKELRPNDNLLILDFDGAVIELPLTMDVNDYVDELFTLAKKYESKVSRAGSEVVKTEDRIEQAREEEVLDLVLPEKVERKEGEWFEKFKWFISSNGFLVITGRDATQNEVLVKKYLESTDLVLHAEIAGSPFTIIKLGQSAPEKTIIEAAYFTASHSRAWKVEMSIDVYYVNPDQVSKTAPAGEFVARGSFMISGKRKYIRGLAPKLCIGFDESKQRIISGPISSVESITSLFVEIVPGNEKTSDISRKIKEELVKMGVNPQLISVDDVQKAIPPGECEIVRS